MSEIDITKEHLEPTIFTNKKHMLIGVVVALLLLTVAAFKEFSDHPDASKSEPKVSMELKNFAKSADAKDLNMLIVDGEIYYLSRDGEYIFRGDIITTSTGENLTLKSRKILSAISKNKSHHANIEQPVENDVAGAVHEEPATSEEDSAIQSYNNAMKERLKANKIMVDEEEEISAANEQTSSGKKDHVDTNQIEDLGASIRYKGVELNKIGFDKSGNKISPEQKIDQVKKMYANVAEKGETWSVVYPAIGKEKLGIVVFSDPTCGFCKRLHSSINELNAAGITVRYLMYPRSLDLGTEDYSAQSVIASLKSAWCSENPKAAFNSIYNGATLPEQDCSISKKQGRSQFPVHEHFMVGKLFGLQATPLSFTSAGQEIYGFESTEKYLEKVGLK